MTDWFERISNKPTLENKLMYVIQTAPDKNYLAIFLKSHLSYVNNSNLNMLYQHLQSDVNCAVLFPGDIKNVIMDAKTNPRLLEVIHLMIERFHY